jgi:DNA-binding CsgD family transcriptional regulator
VAGAQAKVQAGDLDAALDLLAVAEAGPLGEMEQARVMLVQAQLAFVTSRGSDVPALLLEAAKRLEPVDATLARMTYLDAIRAAVFAGRLADPGAGLSAAARAAEAAPPPPGAPSAADRLLDGLAANFTQEYARGLPSLRRALTTFGSGIPTDREMSWLSLAAMAASGTWDDERWEMLTGRYVGHCRRLGALTELRLALTSRAFLHLFAGELTAAGSAIEELRAAMTETESNLVAYCALALAAFEGREAEANALAQATVANAVRRGEGLAITAAEWASAVLNNGLGHYRKALLAAQRATGYPEDLVLRNWALAELVEGASRCGAGQAAAAAHRQLAEMAQGSGTDWALGVQARSHALLASGAEADGLYQESISRLSQARVQSELARAHLLYGEWLRRERRRGEARTQLRQAHSMLEGIGMAAFADRARRELWATGERTRQRSVENRDELTAQESQIAKLARDGLTNPEIGTRLFISARTVEYHLSKVFTKLGITSRSQLDRALS